MHRPTNPRTPTLFNIIQPCPVQVFIISFWSTAEPRTQHQGYPDENLCTPPLALGQGVGSIILIKEIQMPYCQENINLQNKHQAPNRPVKKKNQLFYAEEEDTSIRRKISHSSSPGGNTKSSSTVHVSINRRQNGNILAGI